MRIKTVYSLVAVCIGSVGCSETIHKHYHIGSDATTPVSEIMDAEVPTSPQDAEAPTPSPDCRFAAFACAEGFSCEEADEGFECVRVSTDLGVPPDVMDALIEPEPDMMPPIISTIMNVPVRTSAMETRFRLPASALCTCA